MTDDKRIGYNPWRLPFLLLVCLSLGALWLMSWYGAFDAMDWQLTMGLAAIVLVWGWIRSRQPPPPSSGGNRAPMFMPRSSLSERLRWAFGRVFVVASGFTVIALLIAFASGSPKDIKYGVSVWAIVAGYWLAAVLCGLLLGVLQPYTRYRGGAFAVGALIGCAIYGTAALALPAELAGYWWLAIVMGTVMGGGIGLMEFDEKQE